MTPDLIRINIDELETYEAGAILLALLAYPEPNSDQQREDVQVSLAAQVLRARMAEDPAWARQRQWIKPIYALQETTKAQKALRTFRRRLRDRMVAAKMAIAFLKEGAGQDVKAPRLPKDGKRLSLNRLCVLVQLEVDQADPENVESRVWRTSLPVIHLAIATQILAFGVEKIGSSSLDVGTILTEPEAIKWIIDNAERYARDLAAHPSACVSPHRLIRVQLLPT